MKRLHRGIAVTALQCLLVLSVAGKYAIDRERLPHAWAKTAPVDPNLPVRGRYLSLRLEVEGGEALPAFGPVQLSAEDGRLVAAPAMSPAGVMVTVGRERRRVLVEPVAFFLPEHAADPSRLKPGEELWVEVSVPSRGAPRPIRLGVKKDGVLKPLEVR